MILEGVHKPHNLSAIQRSCDAVGVLEAHAISARQRFRANKGSASGSAKWVRVESHPDVGRAIEHLHGRGFKVYAAHLSERSVEYRQVDYTQPTAILLGTEKFGVSAEALDQVDGEIIIPMVGMVASLNVSVAAAVVLYEAERQRRQAGLYDAPRLPPDEYDRLLFEWGYPLLAERYRALGLDYPRIGEQGEVLDPIPERVRHKT